MVECLQSLNAHAEKANLKPVSGGAPMRKKRFLIVVLTSLMLPWFPFTAKAHWCTSIFETVARVVVKPEQEMVFIGSVGDSETFRVWVKNTYPYLLTNVRMRVKRAEGFGVVVTPAQQSIYPEQTVAFDYTLTRVAGKGDAPLELEIAFLVDTDENRTGNGVSKWRDVLSDPWIVNPDLSELEGSLRELIEDKPQSRALSAAKLAELSADGVTTLVSTCGYPRLKYNGKGVSDGETWYPARSFKLSLIDWQQILRCLLATAILDPDDSRVSSVFLTAMDDPDPTWRGIAAVLAASMRADPQLKQRILDMADSDTCADVDGRCTHYAWTPSSDAQLLAKAALLVLGDEQGERSGIADCSQDHSDAWVRMACAAALGLVGEDRPIRTVLMPMIEDRYASIPLTSPYLLQLVAQRRKSTVGCVSFFADTPEWCNSEDDDCDGQIDENWPNVGEVCSSGLGACERSGVLTCNADGTGVACNAGAAESATEVCGDELDNDCDGTADEDCPCSAGESHSCFGGPIAMNDVGACHAGTQVCEDGLWSACRGQVLPSAEDCTDQADNDCDGEVDNGYQARTCWSSQAGDDDNPSCPGLQHCRGGVWGDCENQGTAEAEICGDDLDNDCDGWIDVEDIEDCPSPVQPLSNGCGCAVGGQRPQSALLALALAVGGLLLGRQRIARAR